MNVYLLFVLIYFLSPSLLNFHSRNNNYGLSLVAGLDATKRKKIPWLEKFFNIKFMYLLIL